VKVENNFGTQDLRNYRTEDEDVRHIVDMHEIVPPFPGATGQD
jgi:hypothetical protein